MRFDLNHFRVCGQGAFSDVLLDEANNSVYKLFIGPDNPRVDRFDLSIGRETWERFRRRVFENEARAHELVLDNQGLAQFVPEYRGRDAIEEVLENGVDVTTRYLPDCCYAMEFVNGAEHKLGHLLGNAEAIQEIVRITGANLTNVVRDFHAAGILYTVDASVILQEGRLALIDFSTEDPQGFAPIY